MTLRDSRPWRHPMRAFACSGGQTGCEVIEELEGECTQPGCDGSDAMVIYWHELDPDWRCAHGDRLCIDCGVEIALFACKTCGVVQEPEPAEADAGQLAMF